MDRFFESLSRTLLSTLNAGGWEIELSKAKARRVLNLQETPDIKAFRDAAGSSQVIKNHDIPVRKSPENGATARAIDLARLPGVINLIHGKVGRLGLKTVCARTANLDTNE